MAGIVKQFKIHSILALKGKIVMNNKEKLETIKKIFLLTVVPQIIMLAALGSIAYWAYHIDYLNVFSSIISVLGCIAFLLLACCAGLFVDNYTPSFFGSRSHEDFGAGPDTRTKQIIYRMGPKSSLTGQRKVYVEERKSSGGANIIIGVIKSLWLCVFGTIRFIIETFRICISENRKAEWDDAYDEFGSNIKSDGVFDFFKFPAICFLVIILGWICILPNIIKLKTWYNPNKIEMSANEITDFAYSEDIGVEFTVDCSVINSGKGKIKHINAYFFVENEAGEVVAEWSDTIKAVFHDPSYDPNWEYNDSGNDELLSKDEEWRYKFYVFVDANEFDVSEFENIDISNLKIYYDLREVRYDNDSFFNYENEEKRVRIEYVLDE